MDKQKQWLNAASLCKIIEKASKSHVKELKIENLHIIFEGNVDLGHDITLKQEKTVEYESKAPCLEPIRIDTEERKELLDLGELMLSDPIAYEEALMSEQNGRPI